MTGVKSQTIFGWYKFPRLMRHESRATALKSQVTKNMLQTNEKKIRASIRVYADEAFLFCEIHWQALPAELKSGKLPPMFYITLKIIARGAQ